MTGPDPALVDAVRSGLTAAKKSLLPWMFYDEVGTDLYEQITRLPEYYLTRAEAEIFRQHGDAIVASVAEGTTRVALAEIGAGTGAKTTLLLEAVLRRQRTCTYLACDISTRALTVASTEIPARLPAAEVKTVVGPHEACVDHIRALADRQVLLFIGSSIGNYVDEDAIPLLRCMRHGLRGDGALVLGTDLKKDPELLHAAYDDAAGVTAAFNKNLLTRLNRELDANFDVDAFRHVAEWNAATSNVELYLESIRRQTVTLDRLSLCVALEAGERIHTETSAKYDIPRVDQILRRAGFGRARTFTDAAGLFAVHVARLAPGR